MNYFLQQKKHLFRLFPLLIILSFSGFGCASSTQTDGSLENNTAPTEEPSKEVGNEYVQPDDSNVSENPSDEIDEEEDVSEAPDSMEGESLDQSAETDDSSSTNEVSVDADISVDLGSDSAPEEDQEESDPEPVVRKISITAKQWEFVPAVVTVNQGDIVQLSVTSIDVEHGIGILSFGASAKLEPGKTELLEFTADKKGTFSMVCTVFCGSGHGSMKGSVIVQ